MKGNSGRLKRSSRQCKVTALVLGLVTPLALYAMLGGTRNGDGDVQSGRSVWDETSGNVIGGYADGTTAGFTTHKHDDSGTRTGGRGTLKPAKARVHGEDTGKQSGVGVGTGKQSGVGAHHATHSRIGDQEALKKRSAKSRHASKDTNGHASSDDSKATEDLRVPRVDMTQGKAGGSPVVVHQTASIGLSVRTGERVRTHTEHAHSLSEGDTQSDVAETNFDDDLIDAPTTLSDEQCTSLATTWVTTRRALFAKHSSANPGAAKKSDLLFFLHIPRTAGRTFHFCYLKLATPEPKRCGKSYDQLRVNVHNPQCDFLASHDDYSLVERFHEQPKVVTMFRDPVARFLSSYEFAVEVSVRSFGTESATPSSRVSTRNVWPWSNAVRFIDKDLRRYKLRVEKDGNEKESIENVYNNTVYTPLHEFVDTPAAAENFHNAQFLQLMGLSTNSNPETEPDAHDLRSCLRKGSAAAEILYQYAEERLVNEVDVTVTHERLDDALRMTSADLNLPMAGPSWNGVNHAPAHSKILHQMLTTVARHGGHFGGNAVGTVDGVPSENTAASGIQTGQTQIVGFTFRFGKVTVEQLRDDKWRSGYLDAITRVLAYTCGVEAKFVKVRPPAVKGAWAKDDGGWQTALVEFPPGMRGTGGNDREKFSSIDELDSFETYEEESDDAEANGAGARNKQKLGPALLLKALKRSRDSETNAYAYLVAAAKGFEEYGEMTIHALGVVTGSNPGGGVVEVYKLGLDPTFVPLGQAFRTCERAQRNKYRRLKSKAFQSLHKHVLGEFEPFVKDDRGQISGQLTDHIRDLNFLDDRLHKFALGLFDERYEKNKSAMEREALPERLQN